MELVLYFENIQSVCIASGAYFYLPESNWHLVFELTRLRENLNRQKQQPLLCGSTCVDFIAISLPRNQLQLFQHFCLFSKISIERLLEECLEMFHTQYVIVIDHPMIGRNQNRAITNL